jgi:hypothetical protein
MKALLFITILLVSTIWSSAQCKCTVFWDRIIIKDTTFCLGNPNHVLTVMMDCDSAPAYTSIFVLYKGVAIMDRGYEGYKFPVYQYGKYEFKEHRTYPDGHLESTVLVRFTVVNRKMCNCAEK